MNSLYSPGNPETRGLPVSFSPVLAFQACNILSDFEDIFIRDKEISLDRCICGWMMEQQRDEGLPGIGREEH